MAWVLAAGCCLLTTGSVSAKPLSAQEIVKRAADEYDRVQDYMVDAKVTVSSPDVHVPEMNVKIYFKKPDKLHVESKSGFAVLPKQGLVAGNPLRNLVKNKGLSLAGSERALGRECYLIKAVVDQGGGRTERARVYIDKERWVVVQMFADTDTGPSLRLSIWYSRIGGKYWMPSKSLAVVEFPRVQTDPDASAKVKESKPGKPSAMTVQFSNYKINTGLSDKIFQKKRR